MNNKFKSKLLVTSVIAANLGWSVPVYSQSLAIEEIFVTARRKDESIQDVPLTVNGVTGEELEQLNIRKFEDLEGVVAGVTLSEDTIAPTASMRGVRFETFAASGNSVEFYMNDALTGASTVVQNVFDIGMIEVLRGPQGTLRGRAAPSGSITVTTAQAETDVFTGYVDTTLTTDGDKNVSAAVNIPLIEDKLGLRLAGFWEENDLNDVTSAFGLGGSEYEGDGWRASLAFQPTENLYIHAMYQRLEPHRTIFTPVESASVANSSLTAANPDLRAKDRLSVEDSPTVADTLIETSILNLSWDINDQHQFNLVYNYQHYVVERNQPIDFTNALDDAYPGIFQGLEQGLYTNNDANNFEVRLQSTEPLFGKVDYVVGFFQAEDDTNIVYTGPIRLYNASNTVSALLNTLTKSERDGQPSLPQEQSYFVNLTYHLSDDTEVSFGAREIEHTKTDYLENTTLAGGFPVNFIVLDDSKIDEDETIYTATIKHNFSYDVMAYATWGTSWRYGANAVGDLSAVKSDLQLGFTKTPPETSESFEIGAKTTWLDQRLRVNVSAYHQTFDDFPLRSSAGVYYANYSDNTGTPPTVGNFNFVSPVPVEVNGFEVDVTYLINESLDVGVLFSYSKGEVDDGVVACNDYLPNDGRADSSSVPPTIGDILAAAGADNLTTCTTSERTDYAPLWTATVTSEYTFNVGRLDAYVRGLWTFYDESENDPANLVDDVDAYNILNLYTGLKDSEGRWEAMLYVKNVMDTEEIVSRERTPASQSFTAVFDPFAGGASTAAPDAISDYRQVSLTPSREIGINLRYNF